MTENNRKSDDSENQVPLGEKKEIALKDALLSLMYSQDAIIKLLVEKGIVTLAPSERWKVRKIESISSGTANLTSNSKTN